MQFIHNDLGQRKRGEIVEITLTSGANVRLMDSSNFSSYKNGRRHSYIGGLGRVRISTLRNENETFSQLNSITYIGVFLRLVTYSHLP